MFADFTSPYRIDGICPHQAFGLALLCKAQECLRINLFNSFLLFYFQHYDRF
jgi:hypothetical protein